MQVSNHANERINERCGLNKKSAERLSKLALENGISHHDHIVTGKQIGRAHV